MSKPVQHRWVLNGSAVRGAVFCAMALAFATSASAKRMPDMSGVWQIERNVLELRTANGAPPLLPETSVVLRQRIEQARGGDYSFDAVRRCVSPGLPRVLYLPYAFEIIQRPKQVTFLFEWNHLFRMVDMTGRPLSPPDYPQYFGASSGQWDGDTLVIRTIGLRADTTLDAMGLPSSETLGLTERYRLLGKDRLQVAITFDDDKLFKKKWNTTVTFKRIPNAEIKEDICLDRLDAGQPAVDPSRMAR